MVRIAPKIIPRITRMMSLHMTMLRDADSMGTTASHPPAIVLWRTRVQPFGVHCRLFAGVGYHRSWIGRNAMPIFITQGRYTREAIKGMLVKPEDRAEAVSRLFAKAGGRLIGHYLTFGEYDFLVIAEMPGEKQMAATLLAVGSAGGVTDLRTTLALSSIDA